MSLSEVWMKDCIMQSPLETLTGTRQLISKAMLELVY